MQGHLKACNKNTLSVVFHSHLGGWTTYVTFFLSTQADTLVLLLKNTLEKVTSIIGVLLSILLLLIHLTLLSIYDNICVVFLPSNTTSLPRPNSHN